jgi:hypothetical protein
MLAKVSVLDLDGRIKDIAMGYLRIRQARIRATRKCSFDTS